MIKWVNMSEFARKAGVCLNTFKKHYLPNIPEPQMQTGTRKFWTQATVDDTLNKMQRGEVNLHTNNTQDF
ncbi:MAG: hypothetical protein Q4A69_09305 [Moraxella sp.]|nr:hypothetical protein [Moraxella sp.]